MYQKTSKSLNLIKAKFLSKITESKAITLTKFSTEKTFSKYFWTHARKKKKKKNMSTQKYFFMTYLKKHFDPREKRTNVITLPTQTMVPQTHRPM